MLIAGKPVNAPPATFSLPGTVRCIWVNRYLPSQGKCGLPRIMPRRVEVSSPPTAVAFDPNRPSCSRASRSSARVGVGAGLVAAVGGVAPVTCGSSRVVEEISWAR